MNALLLGFYGDDFSGSADVMEVLAQASVRTVLFLAPPTGAQLGRFTDLQAVGIAGISRSLPADAMAADLRPALESLGRLAPLVHYKICSTFDSSPEIGSIGRAIEVGRELFAPRCVPVVVGAPALGRYCVFGNLFARSGGDSPIYRLDRHPTMSRHPVTPMAEADLACHLSKQTSANIALLNVLQLDHGAAEHFDTLAETGAEVILIDTLTEQHLPIIGQLLERQIAHRRTLFAVGSSGIEYALTAHWRSTGKLVAAPSPARVAPADRVLVVSGSCSPVTAAQIDAAERAGFKQIPLPVTSWVDGDMAAVLSEAMAALRAGQSVLVHAARGPDDSRIVEAQARLQLLRSAEGRNRLLADALAKIVRAAASDAGMRRFAVAGGDTSGYVAKALEIEALEFLAPLAPGSPLCRAYFNHQETPEWELCFKGGQVGRPDFFIQLARGTR